MRAVIYARVSSDPRGVGRSTAEQQADCRTIIEREGWDIVATFVDNDRSASRYANQERPEYRKLMRFLEQGDADVLVTWEASRTQRDLDAYVKLRDLCRTAGVLWCYSGRVYDLDRTDDAFTTGLDALLAEREASQTRDRVMRSVRANAAEGRPHGRLTYGYERVYDERSGELVEQIIREDQAAVVREAAQRVLAGETPYAVAQDFNTRGVPTPRGGQHGWDLIQIKRLCVNPAYIAKRVHRGQVVADAMWPPILDEATFYALTSKLNDPARRTQRDSAVKYLLSGIATCGACGGRIRARKNKNHRAYSCIDQWHVTRNVVPVDAKVERVICVLLSRPDVADLFDVDDGAAVEARAEVAELKARLEAFYDAAAAGELTPQALARIEARLLPQVEAAERRARTAVVSPAVAGAAGPDAAERWKELALPVKREVIRELVTVRILPVGQGRRTFDPDSVEITPRD